MTRTCFFFDGFNIYHAIKNSLDAKYRWLNLRSLAESYITKKETINGLFYFTALANWKQDAVIRHRDYIKTLEANGITTIYGKFKNKDKYCNLCHKKYRSHEEKQTDVNIALHLLTEAIHNSYDKAIIVSGDSDLVPAIKAVKKLYPEKQFTVVVPLRMRSKEIIQTCDSHIKMKNYHIVSNRFDNNIQLADGSSINCPKEWQ